MICNQEEQIDKEMADIKNQKNRKWKRIWKE